MDDSVVAFRAASFLWSAFTADMDVEERGVLGGELLLSAMANGAADEDVHALAWSIELGNQLLGS